MALLDSVHHLLLLSIISVSCFSPNPTRASVHEYASAKFTSKGNAFVLHGGSEGLYASSLLPFSTSNLSSSSYIRFEKITFKRTKEAAESNKETNSGLVQAIIFEVEDREMIGGSAYGGQRAVCCTRDLAKLGACTQGEVIYRPSTTNPQWPQVFGVSFKGDDVVATLESKYIQITKTGMYNLYFVYCDPKLKGLVIEGKTIWKNPTGYLPGRMAPLMNFYGFMSLAFVVLAVFWFSQYARFWREVLQLQNCITLVIALGMFETALWYFEYAQFNKTGERLIGITIWAVTFGNVKRTVSRMIILLVSMGYGVVRPTLGGLTSKVIMLGTTFFLASEVLEMVENVGTIDDVSGKASLFLVLPVAVLDTFFILWIFTSLSKTLEKLQLYFKSNDVYNERWRIAWIIPAFWQVLSFSLLCVLCALWAPSQNSMRYAYSDDTSEEIDEDTLTLMKPMPSPSKEVWNASALVDIRTSLDTGVSFSGDPEEDKRE
ncbi:uncharacterized protein C26H5.07c-like isoform X2 [Magnolia sinica]|uniref:uncharacterized protein C26H5.07c-like isoform X2 n=1 Tax=Magnolia sinica TaxID=86752 RepID=UPI002658564D|nr:uncharacterized protein C26H5.07c-like isoform X2 [Magnolia sinica]